MGVCKVRHCCISAYIVPISEPIYRSERGSWGRLLLQHASIYKKQLIRERLRMPVSSTMWRGLIFLDILAIKFLYPKKSNSRGGPNATIQSMRDFESRVQAPTILVAEGHSMNEVLRALESHFGGD